MHITLYWKQDVSFLNIKNSVIQVWNNIRVLQVINKNILILGELPL